MRTDTGKNSRGDRHQQSAGHPNMRGVWIFAASALVATATIAAIRLNPEAADPSANIQQTVQSHVASMAQDGPGLPPSWQEIPVKYGDTLGTLLDSRGLYGSAVRAAIQGNEKAQELIELTPGKPLRYRLDNNN